jgi:hypothetical protein
MPLHIVLMSPGIAIIQNELMDFVASMSSLMKGKCVQQVRPDVRRSSGGASFVAGLRPKI